MSKIKNSRQVRKSVLRDNFRQREKSGQKICRRNREKTERSKILGTLYTYNILYVRFDSEILKRLAHV